MPRTLILFDLGGVLLRVAGNSLVDVRNLQTPARDAPAARTSEPMERLFDRFRLGRIDELAFFDALSKLTHSTVESLKTNFNSMLVAPYTGINELLHFLGDRGFLLSCLSNSNLTHCKYVEADPEMGVVMTHFKQKFLSHEIGMQKPDREIYEFVERATGLAGEAIVFFDDSARNCETAASRFGWRTRTIDSSRPPDEQILEYLYDIGLLVSS